MDEDEDTAAAEFLTEADVGARYRGLVAPGTLRNWRARNTGPPFLKIGKGVLYPRSALEAWERRRMIGGERIAGPPPGPAPPESDKP